jgi:hypothetical protein
MRADCWEMRNVLAICMKPIKAFNYTAPVLQHDIHILIFSKEKVGKDFQHCIISQILVHVVELLKHFLLTLTNKYSKASFHQEKMHLSNKNRGRAAF